MQVHRELPASRSLQAPGSYPGCMLRNLRPVVGYWEWSCEVSVSVQASLFDWELIVVGSKLEKEEEIAAVGFR